MTSLNSCNYSEATGDQVLHGVNYATAAAGILDITADNGDDVARAIGQQ